MKRWNIARAERIFKCNADKRNLGAKVGPPTIYHQNDVVWFRKGKKKVDCKHCGKWLRQKEIRQYGQYCEKCSTYLNTHTEKSTIFLPIITVRKNE